MNNGRYKENRIRVAKAELRGQENRQAGQMVPHLLDFPLPASRRGEENRLLGQHPQTPLNSS